MNTNVYVSARRALNDYDANRVTYSRKKLVKKEEPFVEPKKTDICIATGSPMDVKNNK
jgi:hypothetical protein